MRSTTTPGRIAIPISMDRRMIMTRNSSGNQKPRTDTLDYKNIYNNAGIVMIIHTYT
jgi:hypothetical protein